MPEEAYALIEENEKPNEYESSSESDNESLKNNFGKQMVNESSNNIMQFENYDEKTDSDSEMPDHFFLIEKIKKNKVSTKKLFLIFFIKL